MIILWILLGVLGACAAALAVPVTGWYRLRYRSTVYEISRWVATLLKEYAPGSVLIAEPVGRPGFVQFALTGRRRHWRRVEFGLPESDWSRDSIPRVKGVLAAAGIAWTVEVNPGNHAVPHFYRATVEGRDHEVRERLAALIPDLADALGYPSTARYGVKLAGGSSPDAIVEMEDRLWSPAMDAVAARGPRQRQMIGFLRRLFGNVYARDERSRNRSTTKARRTRDER
jgi:hypothetical protein